MVELDMRFLRTISKNRAIRSYARRLPGILRRDYGAAPAYTPAQIRQTIKRCGLNSEYSCYAISMFSNRPAFDAFHHSRGEDCDYDTMRSEVAVLYFHGNSDFTVLDVFALPQARSEASHAAVDHARGDGHHGGHEH